MVQRDRILLQSGTSRCFHVLYLTSRRNPLKLEAAI